ncbi:MAG: single-stranded DNA-binding protein [Aquabacterium sp.]|uniref:single-stranded DNA-binding protein n=1 Tax=Aquabacterium sp. TaxID=1872578 RepID=UPI00122190CB|nr:single-stranded DNA-binding protein [Aquabacterium sp.]TAK93487.1 MAG: single-stranded DNA-binding protein [Aquabacterium sp.]
MSAVLNTALSAKVVALQVLVKGKVEASRRFDGKRYTRIITPAADAYSRPQVVEVRSVSKLGDVGDETEVTCRLGGYTRKPFRTTDKETGETSMVTPVDLTLDAVE